MCGIVGVWGEPDVPLVHDMMAKLVHRGPDAHGVHTTARIGTLGHRRLSIMDPEGGDQPIYNHDRSSVVVANGEVYNFPGLRVHLAERHELRTGSDTEAILHLYEEVGDVVTEHLDGMFAFALADGDELVMARDPIGIKPLYYGRKNGSLYFASEIKALHDWADEIHEFPPGTVYSSTKGFRTYYQVPDGPPRDLAVSECVRLVRQTLEQAVGKRLMSDVPLGVFLSGGLDSSIIAALVKRQMDRLHSFSVGVKGSPDLYAARTVADHLGTIHHEYIITPEEILEKLPEIIYHLESYDQDLVRSAVPCYFTSRLASHYVKVILTGEGADELFAGYDYYKDIHDLDVLHRELRRSVLGLHNVNLQRVDRLTMAHSIEGRVPFLDVEMIEMAQAIPPEYKLYGDRRIEKWILRRAFEDLLPEPIVWRTKEQFDQGTGTVEVLDKAVCQAAWSAESQAYRQAHLDADLRSAEEAYYHRLFTETYPRKVILGTIARWADRPDLQTESPAR